MKKLIHQILGWIRDRLAYFSLRNLKPGIYMLSYPIHHVSLQPTCSSTYLDDVNLYGSAIADRWSRDACGIASLKIAIESLKGIDNPTFMLDSISTLSENANKAGAYIDPIGWKHKSLTKIAAKYGLNGSNFVEESHFNICKNILADKVVIASVTLYFKGGEPIIRNGKEEKKPKGGHLIVLKGFKWEGNNCTGFFYDDCQDRILPDNANSEAFVNITDFLNSYSEKAIYIWR